MTVAPYDRDLCERLLRLALDPAAQPGEIEVAGRKFIEHLRKTGTRAEDLFSERAEEPRPSPSPTRNVRMPFGRYRGVLISELPDDYLAWLWENVDLRANLQSAVRAELERRQL